MANCTVEDSEDLGWDSPNIPAAIIVSIGSGIATSIGGALVFCPDIMKKVPPNVILGISLALSAGVMLYVSFIEIFSKALDEISSNCDFSEGGATALTTLMFFLGMLVCVLLELLVHRLSPGGHNHGPTQHEMAQWPNVNSKRKQAPAGEASQAADGATEHAEVAVTVVDSTQEKGEMLIDAAEQQRLHRMGVMTAAAIALHNFPEGLATFLATVSDVGSGASLGVAIAIHNIPEGLCVAMPLFYATRNKWKAFFWSVLSGVTEPIGGIVGFAALQPVFTDVVYGCVFSMVGGMMVFIVCHELLPAAHRYLNNDNSTTTWLIIGMIVMASSLVIFAQ